MSRDVIDVTEPRTSWVRVLGILMFAAVLGPFGLIIFAVFDDGPSRLLNGAICTALILLTVPVTQSFLLPRRERPLVPDAAGSVSFVSPLTIVLPVLGILAAVLSVLVSGPWLYLTAPQTIDRPFLFGVMMASVACLIPDVVRLFTGRLYRWRLVVGEDAVTYRGYRTNRTVPWKKVKSVEIDHTWPGNLVIRTKGRREPDIVVPYRAFDVPAEQFVATLRPKIGRRDP